MLKSLLLSFLFLFPLLAGAQERLPLVPNPADTNTFLYHRKLLFVGSSVHIDMNYKYLLLDLAETMIQHPNWRIEIRGHVCCGPSEKISKKRAKNVYDYLLHLGVPEKQMSYRGYSDLMPFAFPEKTEEDENLNRRVDFLIHRK
jgi:outer membrane protein OmpA-like peptidoglycan-associated protein